MNHGHFFRIRTAILGLTLSLAASCGGGGGGGGGAASLSYTLPVFVQGIAFTDITPTAIITPTGYAITSGTLPLGMAMNTTTGVISGFAAVATTSAVLVTIQATDGMTTVEVMLSISIGLPSKSRFALATHLGDHVLSVLALDDAIGMMRHASYAPTGTVPSAVAIARGGNFVYTANNGADNVSGFAFDTTGGALTPLGGSPFSSSVDPIDIATDPGARFAYVLCSAGGSPVVHQYSMDVAGALADLAPSTVSAGASANALYMEPLGRFVYVSFGAGSGMVQPYVLNQTSGQLAAGTAVAAGGTPIAMAGTPNGEILYVSNRTTNEIAIYDINSTTGALLLVGSTVAVSGGTLPEGLTVTPNGNFLFVTLASGGVQQFSISGSGTLTSLGTTTAPAGVNRVITDHSGSYAFVSSGTGNELSMFDVSGGGTLVAQTVDRTRLRDTPSDLEMVPGLAAVSFATNFLYAGNTGDDDINQFAVDSSSGALTALMTPTVLTGDMPNWVEAHPFKSIVYLVNANEVSNAIEVFSVAGSGSLTTSQMVAQGGVSSWSLHVDPSGLYAFGVNSSTGQAIPYTVAADGMLTANGAAIALGVVVPAGGAIHPTGKYFYLTQSLNDRVRQFRISGLAGTLADLSPTTLTTADQPISCTVDATGRYLYVASIGALDRISAYSIAFDTGALTELTASPFTTSDEPIDVVADPDGRHLYVAVRGSSPGVQTFIIDVDSTNGTEDGALTSSSLAVMASIPFKLRLNAAGDVLYASHAVTSGMVETFAVSSTGILSSIDIDATGNTTAGVGLKTALE